MAQPETTSSLSAVTEGQSKYRNTRATSSTQEVGKNHLNETKIESKRIKQRLSKEENITTNSRKRLLETESEATTIENKRKKSKTTSIYTFTSNIASRTRSQTIANQAHLNYNSNIATSSSQLTVENNDLPNLQEPLSQKQNIRKKSEISLKNKEVLKTQASKPTQYTESRKTVALRSLRSNIGLQRETKSVDVPTRSNINHSVPNIKTQSREREASSSQSHYNKALNLGPRLSRNSSAREPQVGPTDTQGQPSNLLRRSSRAKSSINSTTTSLYGSEASSSTNPNSATISSGGRLTQRCHPNKTISSVIGNSKLAPGSVAGPSTSSVDSSGPSLSAMAEEFAITNNVPTTSSTNINPFIKLQKLSMPLLDANSSSHQEPVPVLARTGISDNSSFVSSNQQIDSESDDSEVGRLQALLEARGLPPQLFGALGPRMHHLLHRTMSGASTSKAQALLQNLQSNDESQQLQAAIEMCQMLVMGNEDTLAGFPFKQVVPALTALLRMEHNFDLMMNACRALAYMLEALPRSSATVVDAIPAFLEKLQVIQWVDVAEQSLTALETLSRRHNKCILQANGISTCLTYLDFFSINAQRCALAITANCCQNLNNEEFHYIKESLPLLSRLLAQEDKKSVESICVAFHRLVDSFQHDPNTIKEIASMELLKNCQHLLIITPPILNTGTFTNVVRMLSIMCANCPELAIVLLKNDIASTLLYLLTGSTEIIREVELVQRTPSELYEITYLIGELMPRLPTDGIFSVDSVLEKPEPAKYSTVQWQWKDDRGIWHTYNALDSRMIEAAHLNSDDEISLTIMGRTYTIDFNSMQQINEDSGTTRSVQKRLSSSLININTERNTRLPSSSTAKNVTNSRDYASTTKYLGSTAAIEDCSKTIQGLADNFIRTLFNVLYEVYSSSAGPAVRHVCLRALLRMIHYADRDLLREVLKNQVVAAHIAGMMASKDIRIVIGALQMAEILMQKLNDTFSIHFRREGVMHHIHLLAISNNGESSGIINNPDIVNTSLGVALPETSFNFDQSIASTSKGHASKTISSAINYLPKMQIASPSTSSTSTHSSVSNYSLSHARDSDILNTRYDIKPSKMINLQTSKEPSSSSTSKPLAEKVQIDLLDTPDQSQAMSEAQNEDHSERSYSKVADILKRKIPPKRKTHANRAKNRSDRTTSPRNSTQDLMNKQLNQISVEKNTINTTTGSKPKATHTPSKASSFLQSLNPIRWRKVATHATPGCKDSDILKPSFNTHFIATENREKARQWIRQQSISFVSRYADKEGNGPHSAVSILLRLQTAILKLGGDLHDCFYALKELKNIIIESDISPFEVNHSGLIKALIDYLAKDDGKLCRNTRLRAFLHIFVGLPLHEEHSECAIIADSNSFSALIAKLNGCVTQLEQFPVKVHDFPAGFGGRSNTSALKFFNTHQLKCNLQRHPECNNLRQWKGGTVKIDPLALVQAIERYLVVRGYGGIRQDSEDDSDDDIDNIDAAAMVAQSSTKHKLQFLIGNNILPYNMTVYQAVKQYSLLTNDQSETDTDSEMPIGNSSIWILQHTIHYRPVDEDNPNNSTNRNSLTATTKKSTKNTTIKYHKRKQERNDEVVITIQSPLTPFLTSQLPKIVTVQDASLDVILLLRILNALNRYWNSLYYAVPQSNIVNQIDFIHPKIAAKASRQLQDPLVIMTGNLPHWLQQIATVCPFLLPFETRQLLFYAISFDRDRALQRLLETTPDLNASDSSERVTPRLDRRKRPISRENILKQAETIMQDFGHSKALLEIQYENEVGTGLGPTLEFYALVSTELQRCDLELWNDGNSYKRKEKTLTTISNNTVLSTLNNVREDYSEASATSHNPISFAINPQSSFMNNMELQAENDDFIMSHNVLIERADTILFQSKEIANVSTTNEEIAYVNAPMGLFPSPLGKSIKAASLNRMKSKFKFLGKFMAKAVMDSRMLDLPFSIPFYRWLLGEEQTLGLPDLYHVAPEVQSTLLRLNEVIKQRNIIQNDTQLSLKDKTEKIESLGLDGCPISDLGLDFILPGHSCIELKRGGKDIAVTIYNLDQYLTLVTHWFLHDGVIKQFESLKEGFDSVFPTHRLAIFYPEELENVFCGSGINTYFMWDVKMLAECCRTDHGFTQDSRAIKYFYDILSNYTKEEQRLFLQFVTGSPRLPTGGFKALSPPLTIVRKKIDGPQSPDGYLPSVMTCVNYLKLPDYSTREIMREKLKIAASEGRMCFHLS